MPVEMNGSSTGDFFAKESSSLAFTKMQALGNDFILLAEDELLAMPGGASVCDPGSRSHVDFARAACDRRFGVGADGLIIGRRLTGEAAVTASGIPRLGWTYTNSDGSASAMCGNGLRCLARWAVDKGWLSSREMVVATAVGDRHLQILDDDLVVASLGVPLLLPADIPLVKEEQANAGGLQFVQIGGKTWQFVAVSMGNPHCVLFDQFDGEQDAERLAAELQGHPMFPLGVNVEIVTAYAPDYASVLVWERGCGRTLACASGACAVLVAGVVTGKLSRQAEIRLPGGALSVHWPSAEASVRISGPARKVFDGKIALGYLRHGGR